VYSSSKCFGTLMSRRKNMVVEVCVWKCVYLQRIWICL
jgi:hypothetical protein